MDRPKNLCGIFIGVMLTKGIRSMQSQSMQDQQQRNVRANIERRAELRGKTSMKFPNIANLLTGGAPGPIGLMGQMQKQASKPFKGVWDYKKAQEASKGFEGEMQEKFDEDPFYKMSKAENKKKRRFN